MAVSIVSRWLVRLARTNKNVFCIIFFIKIIAVAIYDARRAAFVQLLLLLTLLLLIFLCAIRSLLVIYINSSQLELINTMYEETMQWITTKNTTNRKDGICESACACACSVHCSTLYKRSLAHNWAQPKCTDEEKKKHSHTNLLLWIKNGNTKGDSKDIDSNRQSYGTHRFICHSPDL